MATASRCSTGRIRRAVTFYECSKENGLYQPCNTPLTYLVDVSNNQQHQFSVRAFDAAGNRSGAVSWTWKVEQNVRFTITGNAKGKLYPDLPMPLELTLHNDNNFPIYVIALLVTIEGNADCPPSANIDIDQSDINAGANKVLVPANGTMILQDYVLPGPQLAARAPQIRLMKTLDDQELCKNVTFNLTYEGTATK